MNDKNKYEGFKFAMGIDVGKKGGLACLDLQTGKLITVTTLTAWEMIAVLLEYVETTDSKETFYVVEDPNLNSNIFGSFRHIEKILAPYKSSRGIIGIASMNKLRSAYAIGLKHASSVGMNRGYAAQVIEFLKAKNQEVLQVSPSIRQNYENLSKKMNLTRAVVRKSVVAGMKMPTKLKAPDFKLLTGWEQQTNEHSRDAATLVWKMSKPIYMSLKRKQPK